jgi:AcrR family transcriptional regulator
MVDEKGRYRQQRQGVLRERALQAAVDVARDNGWNNVTMRKVADRIDYTHAALYAYFTSKEDLLLALLQQGHQVLRAHLDAARAAAPTPDAALFAVMKAYWDFAHQQPELYQVMHGFGGVAFSTAETRADGQQIAEPVAATIEAVLVHHGHTPRDVDQKVELLWSTMHGLVTLTMAGRFEQAHAATLATQAVRDALTVWGVPQPD